MGFRVRDSGSCNGVVRWACTSSLILGYAGVKGFKRSLKSVMGAI